MSRHNPGAQKSWRPGLRARLLAAVMAVLVVLLGLTALLVLNRSERALLDSQHARFQAATQQLAKSLRYAMLARSDTLLRPDVNSFAKNPDLVDVQVVDSQGQKRITLSGPQTHLGPMAQDLLAEVRAPILAPQRSSDDDELESFGLMAPSQSSLGWVRARFSQQSLRDIQRRLRGEVLGVFVLVGALGLWLVYLLGSSVVRRTRALAAAAAQVASGRLDVQVEQRGSDELAALSHDFNAMSQALSEQRRALDDAAEQLAEQEALSTIGRATAVIAHEMKNPMGILLGAAQIVANPQRPDASRIKAGQIIAEEVPRLERTLNELLHYASPKVLHRSEVDAQQICREVAQRASLVGGPAEGLNIEIRGPSQRVFVDAQHLTQIALNLISNAAQADATQVRVTLQPKPEQLEIIFADDGPGVPENLRDALFRPFVTSKQRGTGLGLSISRRLARKNGGDLRLDQGAASDLHGACFLLALPSHKEQSQP